MKRLKHLLILLLAVLTLSCVGFACGGSGGGSGGGSDNVTVSEGKYYFNYNGYVVNTQFIYIHGNQWQNEQGLSGVFSVKGDEITFTTQEDDYQMVCVYSKGVMSFYSEQLGHYYYCLDGVEPPQEPTMSGGNTSQGSSAPSVKVDINFNANGGKFSQDKTELQIKVFKDTLIEAPENPTRYGYLFAGWSKTKSIDNLWNFAQDKVTDGMTLFAVWKEQTAVVLSVEGGTVSETEINILVPYTTEMLSLSSKVVVSKNSYWKLYYDILGTREIPTKMAASTEGALLNGANVFYIVVTSSDNMTTNVYKLTVYRSYPIEVVYTFKGVPVYTDTAYTGYEYSPNYILEQQGYNFNYWKLGEQKFVKGILNEPTVLVADYTCRTDTEYKVEYYFEDIKEENFSLREQYTKTLIGTTDSEVTAEIIPFDHFTATENEFKGIIAGDGSTTIKVYYYRHYYEILLYTYVTEDLEDKAQVSGVEDGVYSNEETVELKITLNPGYEVVGWYNYDNNQLLGTNTTYSFNPTEPMAIYVVWQACTNTPYKVEYHLQNVSGSGYTADNSLTKNLSGTTDTTVYAEIKQIEHFTAEKTQVSGNLNGNGSTVLKVYYTRNSYAVTLTAQTGGTVSGAGNYLYNKQITISATANSGYAFNGWYQGDSLISKNASYTFNVVGNVSLTASWSPNTNTPYKVEYYLQNVSGSGYSIDNSLTKNLTGTTDTTVYAEIKDIQHFTAEKQQVSGNINGNGGTVLKVYYTRNSYAVTLIAQTGGTVSGAGNYFYDKQITISANANSGYAFNGWYQGDSLISNNASYTFNVTNSISLTAQFIGVQPFFHTNGAITGLTDYGKTLSDLTIPTQIDGITITTIASNAFKNETFTSIIISDNVTSIGSSAFYNCSRLTSVTIGNSVTSIGGSAFRDCDSLTSVTIPGKVTSIGSSAFYSCFSLTSVTIPESVTSIGDSAFEECSSLQYNEENGLKYLGNSTNPYLYLAGTTSESITTATINSNCKLIGSSAFYSCFSLTSVTIPDSVTSIESGAFRGCGKLQSITIPFVGGSKNAITASSSTLFGYIFGTNSYTGATAVKQYYASSSYTTYYIPTSLKQVTITGGNVLYDAFENCTSLTSVTIGNSVTSISIYAFWNCTSLTSIMIGNSVTSIDSYAFDSCPIETATMPTNAIACIPKTKLKNVIINGGTRIGSSAFSSCYSLTSVIIPNSVTSIGSYAFRGCDSLTSITIPNSVTSIGDYAFYKCTSLTSVTIPNSVTSIGSWAFEYCDSLTSVNYTGDINKWVQISFGNSFANPIYYAKKLYINGEEVTSANIDSATKISSYAFYNCTSLTNVTILDSVTSIGERAFCDCDSLTSVTIGENVTSIGDRVFYGCTSLTTINVSEDNKNYASINGNLYNKDKTLLIQYAIGKTEKSFTIPNSVTSIGNYAFVKCTSLTSVTIGESVTSIGKDAFYNCYSLTSITIPNSVKSIGSSAFEDCTSLTSVTIPDSVTSIGSYAFYNCDSLTSVTFKNTNGWWVSKDSSATSGTNISSADLANPSTAAEYLTSTYYYHYWKRS